MTPYSETGDAAISIRGVRKSYRSAAGGAPPALDGFDLEVCRGTVCGLLGPNGAGKTTAVRIIATLLTADAGDVRVAGFDAVRHGREVRRRIGLVGQYAAVDEELSGRQNLVMFGRLNHLGVGPSRQRADDLLGQFGLAETGGMRVADYSGGMRRRLDLAAALVVASEVLLVDEPTTGLDPVGRRDVWRAIRELVHGGTTVLLTTQYLEEADELADRVALLARGRVVAEGTPAQLKAQVGEDWIEIHARDDADTARIVDLAMPWSTGTVRAAGSQVQVPVTDRTDALLGVAAALRDAGIRPADVGVRRPTLDDVFIQFTGAAASDQPAAGVAIEEQGVPA